MKYRSRTLAGNWMGLSVLKVVMGTLYSGGVKTRCANGGSVSVYCSTLTCHYILGLCSCKDF